jgi:hypothetical protein
MEAFIRQVHHKLHRFSRSNSVLSCFPPRGIAGYDRPTKPISASNSAEFRRHRLILLAAVKIDSGKAWSLTLQAA